MYGEYVIATPLVFSFGDNILERITEYPSFRSQLVIKRSWRFLPKPDQGAFAEQQDESSVGRKRHTDCEPIMVS